MDEFENMLRTTFGHTESFQLVVKDDLESLLGPADETKVTQLLDVLFNKKHLKTVYEPSMQFMMGMSIDQGRANAISYLKSCGFQAVNNSLRNAAKLIASS